MVNAGTYTNPMDPMGYKDPVINQPVCISWKESLRVFCSPWRFRIQSKDSSSMKLQHFQHFRDRFLDGFGWVSLPGTNSKLAFSPPESHGGWNTILSYWVSVTFQGLC